MDLNPENEVVTHERLNLIQVTVESNHPVTFIQAVKLTQERLASVAQIFLQERKSQNECKQIGKCCRDRFEDEDPRAIFIEPIYSENTFANLSKAFKASAQNELLLGRFLYSK